MTNMTNEIESILPRLLAEIRDTNREGFREMREAMSLTNHRLASMDARLGSMDGRLAKIDDRLEKMDGKLESMDGKLEKMDGKLEKMDGKLEKMAGKLESMDGKLDRGHHDNLTTHRLLGKLVEVMSDDVGEQILDIRRRLTNIEERLQTR
jgi:chromosome segregation ATPase